MKFPRTVLFILLPALVLLTGTMAFPQNQDTLKIQSTKDTIHQGRLTAVIVTEGCLYAGSLTGLYYLWYANYPQSTFHFFNDNDEWLQMDKCGHVMTAYYLSHIGYASFRWTGMERKKAIWYGGLTGFAYMTNIEILDGFSSQWGFSWGDFTSNTIGTLLFMGQQLIWDEQRFVLKFSFHTTSYPRYRPDLLGKNLIQVMLKDYNGQSYWVSGNISSFLPKETRFPKWLNVAIGYSAEGMAGATSNPESHNSQMIPEFQRYRQFMLSPDLDLTRIATRSKALKAIFNLLSFIKIPAPAIEYNTTGRWNFYLMYF